MKSLDGAMGPGLVFWTIVLLISTFVQTSEGNICVNDVEKTETKRALCSQFMDMMFNTSGQQKYSYHLKEGTYDPAELVDIQAGKSSTAMCTYERSYKEKVSGCCDGWKGDSCVEPICGDECNNNGQCVEPYVCECYSDYTGHLCEDNIAEYDYAQTKQYCYGTVTCHGDKAPGFNQSLVTKDDCCKLGGKGWGAQKKRCDDCSVVGNEENINQSHDPGFRSCLSYGGVYYRTFDGKQYNFGGKCKYILARASEQWQVVMHQINCETPTGCKKKIVATDNRDNKIEVEDGIVIANGQVVDMVEQMASQVPGNAYTVMKNGDWIWIKLEKAGLRIKVDKKATVYVTLDKKNSDLLPRIDGLCGNSNGNPDDDFITQSGADTTSPTSFGNSWVYDDDKCPLSGSIPNYCKNDSSKIRAMEECGIMRSNLFADCRAKMDYLPWHKICVNEYCQTPDDEKDIFRCDEIAAFANECAQHGAVTDWRSRDLCPKSCPPGLIYNECGSYCPRSCNHILVETSDTCAKEQQCVPGCECPSNKVFQDGKCVSPSECNCHFNRVTYSPNATMKMDCNSCTCSSGKWICTNNPCAQSARVNGLSHITTFDGKHYSLDPSPCFYDFIKPRDPEGSSRTDLTVQVKFDTCPTTSPQKGRHCMTSVVIKYKSTKVEIRRDEISVNGQLLNNRPGLFKYFSNDLVIEQATTMMISVRGFGYNIFYNGRTELIVRLERLYEKQVLGLFGNYDGVTANDFETQHGSIEAKGYEFAHGYKDCLDPSKEYHHPCDDISKRKEAENKCKPLVDHTMFSKCSDHEAASVFYSQCIEDYCASKSQEANNTVCATIEAFALMCTNKDDHSAVNWLSDTTLAEMCGGYAVCQGGSVYTACASICEGSCRDVQVSDSTCMEMCMPGCVCPEGQLLSESNVCVDIEECGCFDKYSSTYKDANVMTIQGCTNCTCKNAKWVCDDDHCDDTISCPKNQIYRKSLTACEPTCATLGRQISCANDLTYDGCACPKDLYRTPNGTCVTKDQCPCPLHGEYYSPGATFEESCKTYRCKDTQWSIIAKEDCPAVCWASGDPHYHTFDQNHYNFQGDCSYTLAREKNGDTFDITAENIGCGSNGVTCTKSVELTVKGGLVVSLVRGSLVKVGDTTVNGLRYKTSSIDVIVESPWVRVIIPDQDVSLLWDNGTRVYIYLGSQWRERVEGLCGNYDGIDNNDYQSQNGMNTQDVTEFANSWKTSSACADVVNDKGDLLPCQGSQSIRASWAEESCKVIREGPLFEKCRQHSNIEAEEMYQDCLTDACSCDKGGDCECLCTAIASFAELCNAEGVHVKWRTPRFCPIMCEGGRRYTPCRSPCEQTCENIGNEPEPYCNDTQCVEGCSCPEGYVENGKDGECMPADKCPCRYQGAIFPAESVILQDCMTCTCVAGSFRCVGESCKPNCTEEEFTCSDGKCISNIYECDTIHDCNDGSDENNCTCSTGQFQCRNGQCINGNEECDGMKDCLDSTDEQNCEHHCKDEEKSYKCPDGNCIPVTFRCDEENDCSDGSDEANCTTCDQPGMYQCTTTLRCIPPYVLCDGHDDCGDAEDEIGCTTTTTRVTTTTTPTTTAPETTSTTTSTAPTTTTIPTTTESTTPEGTTSTTTATTSTATSTTTQSTTTECDIQMISKDNSTEVDSSTTDGNGNGLDETFVPDSNVLKSTIRYTIKSTNDYVKFFQFSAKVWNVASIQVFVLDKNNNPVAPINTLEVTASEPYPKTLSVNLDGAVGVTLEIVLEPAYGSPRLDGVTFVVCYTPATTTSSVTTSTTPTTTTAPETTSTTTTTITVPTTTTSPTTTESTTSQETTSTTAASTSTTISATTLSTTTECDIQMISKDNSTEVVSSTTDGNGNGLTEAFVPNSNVSKPTISYTIKSTNDYVKFFQFSAKVWNVANIQVFVLDKNNHSVAPINPRTVSVFGSYPQTLNVNLDGTVGVTLKIVLEPAYDSPRLDGVTFVVCYTPATTTTSVTTATTPTTTTAPETTSTTTTTITVPTTTTSPTTTESTTSQETTSTTAASTSTTISATTLSTTTECDIQMISKDNSTEVVSSTTDGNGNGLTEAFVPNSNVSKPTISYTIKSTNDYVKFFQFSAKVWNVANIQVFVLDKNNHSVAPINPRTVSVFGSYPQTLNVNLDGTVGVTLKIVLEPAYDSPRLDGVTFVVCYTPATTTTSVTTATTPTTTTAPETTSTTTTTITVPTTTTSPTTTESTTSQETTSTTAASTSTTISATTLSTTTECDIQMISKDNSTEVVSSTTDGNGNGLTEAFVPNSNVSKPTISYTIKSTNDYVKFFQFSAKVWNVANIQVFVLDKNNHSVAPINPRTVSVFGSYPQTLNVNLDGTVGVTLKIVLEPAYDSPRLDGVTFVVCYTPATTTTSVTTATTPTTTTAPETTSTTTTTITVPTTTSPTTTKSTSLLTTTPKECQETMVNPEEFTQSTSDGVTYQLNEMLNISKQSIYYEPKDTFTYITFRSYSALVSDVNKITVSVLDSHGDPLKSFDMPVENDGRVVVPLEDTKGVALKIELQAGSYSNMTLMLIELLVCFPTATATSPVTETSSTTTTSTTTTTTTTTTPPTTTASTSPTSTTSSPPTTSTSPTTTITTEASSTVTSSPTSTKGTTLSSTLTSTPTSTTASEYLNVEI
ncbi:SCO-spondin-like isoform X2 [Pecten maximus]|uniref:SCO-spondin-like isoform X2 n=1 Tax=Pecten maximus TaxID=6579 RepID=UPI001457FB9D|nr:SCO-spondin-like isoform X2 [Pecten maximus]